MKFHDLLNFANKIYEISQKGRISDLVGEVKGRGGGRLRKYLGLKMWEQLF
jgi:hypothetical protein